MAPPSDPPSRTNTPRSFTAQAPSAEDLLKTQTVGLVNLSDFRKRRAEALEQKEREANDKSLGRFTASGAGTPDASDGAATPLTDSASGPPKKKKKKQTAIARGKLSFGLDENDEDWSTAPSPATSTPANRTPSASPAPPSNSPAQPPRRLTPNPTLTAPPKALTKANLAAETLTREILRKEFLALQESIKATEIAIPFVFYDGTNIPGGRVKVKKGDHIWLFLDRCRKVGAELGVSGGGSGTGTGDKNARREWARVSVDDLMLVRGDLILPHHFEFYYFITNSILSTAGTPIFDFGNSAPREAPRALTKNLTEADLDALEGANDDPIITKVVDRRWYERNKHIYPATLWVEYEQGKDYSKEGRKRRDGEGNAFFFS